MATLSLRVKPNAPRCGLARDERGLVAKIDAPPVDGAANERLIRFLAREVFGVPQSDVRVVRGERGRNKVIDVDLPESEVAKHVQDALERG